MKRLIVILGFAGVLTAGCGSGSDLTMTASERARAEAAQSAMQATSTTIETTTTTTMVAPTTAPTAPTTTTTICIPVDTTAQQRYVDSTEASIRQVEGAIAGIQLVIDNGIRDRAGALRRQATVQEDYNEALAAFHAFGGDTNADELAYQAGRLADAKDVVADWDSLLAKARGDLSRARTTKADFEKKARDMRVQIAAVSSCS